MKSLVLVLLAIIAWPSESKILEECKDKQVDLLFVLDESGSVNKEAWETQKKFVKSIVKRSFVAPDQVQIALISFGSSARIAWKLNTYKNTAGVLGALQKLEKVSGDKGSFAHLALNKVKDLLYGKSHGGRTGALKMVIYVTDGASRYPDKTEAAAEALHKAKVTIAAVGVDGYRTHELRAIASDPSDKYVFTADDWKDLVPLAKKVAAVTCAGYNAFGVCPKGGMDRCCPDDQASFEGSCYFFGSLLLNDFRTADKACKAMNGELVTIDSYQEDEFLVQTLDRMQYTEKMQLPTGFYTGWHKDVTWKWLSGEEGDYTPNRWYGSYPYGNTAYYGECMVMHKSYRPWKWIQTKCGTKYGFICEL